LIELPENLVDASQQISQACTPRGIQNASTFISTGRGGLPLSPNQPVRKPAVITNWVDLPSENISKVVGSREQGVVKERIIEAQKIVVDKNGDTFLVAESPQNHTSSTISCN
ncbi:MAG: S-layer family protein, partial [Rivularia sp. (in: cyanobacteria)]